MRAPSLPRPRLRARTCAHALLVAALALVGGCGGGGGGDGGADTPVGPAPTITVGASTATVSLARGGTGVTQIALTRAGGYAGAVTLAAEALPAGVTATFAPATLTGATAASTLTLTAAADAAVGGPATVVLRAQGAAVGDATLALPVMVTADQSPALTLAQPADVAVTSRAGGASVAVPVTVGRAGLDGPVTVSLVEPPAGITAAEATVAAGATAGTLTVQVAQQVAPGARTLTVRAAGAGGTPSATRTLTLTVHDASAPAGYTLAVSPTPVAVTAGGGAAPATVTVTRVNFAGSVTLAASGAPTGLTVTAPVAPVSAASAALGVQAASFLAPGDYPITLTGSAPGLAPVTATFVARVAAAGTPGPSGNTTRVTFCESAAPVWVAAQNGDGAWTRLPEVAPRQYDVTVAARAGIAAVAPLGAGYAMEVHYLSAAEVAALGQAGCVDPGPGAWTMHASVAGLSDGQSAIASLGSGFAATAANGPFQIWGVGAGTHTLVASRWDSAGRMDRVVVRRGVHAADGGSVAALDFGAAEAFAPATGAVTVQNAGTDQLSLSNLLYTGMVGGGLLGSTSGASPLSYAGVPAARLQGGEYNMLTVTAGAIGGAGPQRTVVRFGRDVADLTVALGPVLGAPTVASAGTAPHLRPRVQLAAQAEYAEFVAATFDQGSAGASAARRQATVSRSAAYAGAAPATWELSVPDLSGVAGFDATWGLRPGTDVEWEVHAFGGSVAALRGVALQDGTTARSASRAGTLSGTTGAVLAGSRAGVRALVAGPALEGASPAARARALQAARAQARLARLTRAALATSRR